jgi:hypothetical protein
METQTVYAKLKEAESFLQQIPEDIRTLYKFKVTHTEYDSVVMSFRLHGDAYVGFLIERLKEVSVNKNEYSTYINIRTNGADITLHENGYSHITVF